MDSILKVEGLCRSFGEFQLKDVSFSLPRGYIMGFIGPNGAGKTTTIKLMKFSLALALSHRAELIIMDEPTSGLDPVFRSELLEILQNEIQDENRGILFSSHITSDLERIADYICFINNGQIVFSQTCDELREKYLLVKGPLDLLDEPARQLMLNIKENDFGFEGLSDQPERIRRLLGNQALYESPSLDQIVLYTVRRDRHVALN